MTGTRLIPDRVAAKTRSDWLAYTPDLSPTAVRARYFEPSNWLSARSTGGLIKSVMRPRDEINVNMFKFLR